MGEECTYMYEVHFSSRTARDISIFWKRSRATKPWLISTALNIVSELDSDKKVKNLKEKENTIVLREIQCFGLQFTAFFSKFHAPKTWFEFSRVKLYRTDLQENKNYFELAGGNEWRKSKGNRFWFESSGIDCISKPVCTHEFVIQSKLSQLLRESKTVVSTSLIVYCWWKAFFK